MNIFFFAVSNWCNC